MMMMMMKLMYVLYIIYNLQQTLTFVDLLQVLKSYNIILSSEKSSWGLCSYTIPHVERRNIDDDDKDNKEENEEEDDDDND